MVVLENIYNYSIDDLSIIDFNDATSRFSGLAVYITTDKIPYSHNYFICMAIPYTELPNLYPPIFLQ